MGNSQDFFDCGELRLRKSRTWIALACSSANPLFENLERDRQYPSYNAFDLFILSGSAKENELKLDELRGCEGVSVGSHVFLDRENDVPLVPNGLIYVRLAAHTSGKQATRLFANRKLNIHRHISAKEIVVATTTSSANPVKVALSLEATKSIELAQPDLIIPTSLDDGPQDRANFLPTEVTRSNQWYLQHSGSISNSDVGLNTNSHANVIAMWNAMGSIGNNAVSLGMVDRAFDDTHPDLGGDHWVHRFDASAGASSGGGAGSRLDPEERQVAESAYDLRSQWHGTACAGIAIARGNGTGIVGAAPNAKFIPVKASPAISSCELVRIFEHFYRVGARVVSCSLQIKSLSVTPQAIRAINDCAKGKDGRGCLIFFSAGNKERALSGLAAKDHLNIKVVGATNSLGNLNTRTNCGNKLWICAPSGQDGKGVLGMHTTDYSGSISIGGNSRLVPRGYAGGDFHNWIGNTSGATPLVAGIAACLMSYWPQANASDIVDAIQSTATKVAGVEHNLGVRHIRVGYGKIDALAAALLLCDRFGIPVRI